MQKNGLNYDDFGLRSPVISEKKIAEKRYTSMEAAVNESPSAQEIVHAPHDQIFQAGRPQPKNTSNSLLGWVNVLDIPGGYLSIPG